MGAKQKILVTGADGFIGSHVVEALVKRHYRVRAFVFYNSFNSDGWLDHTSSDVRSKVEFFRGDVRDAGAVNAAMADVDAVIHLAALISIPFSYIAPESYIDTNIKGSLNVFNAARANGVKRVIHTSTSEVYGTAQFVPITELHPLVGQSPYSASKIGADQLAQSFFLSFDTPIITVRPFNCYGPRQSARAVIPTIISQLAAGNSTIKLGALTPTRDFNFIDDTVSGFIAALEAENGVGETVNLGSNFEISIAQTAELISEVMDVSISINVDEQRLRPQGSEVDRLWSDNSKAFQIFGWSPQYSGLEGMKRGISKTVDWFTDPENLKRYKSTDYNL